MKCQACSRDYPDSAAFCPFCGTRNERLATQDGHDLLTADQATVALDVSQFDFGDPLADVPAAAEEQAAFAETDPGGAPEPVPEPAPGLPEPAPESLLASAPSPPTDPIPNPHADLPEPTLPPYQALDASFDPLTGVGTELEPEPVTGLFESDAPVEKTMAISLPAQLREELRAASDEGGGPIRRATTIGAPTPQGHADGGAGGALDGAAADSVSGFARTMDVSAVPAPSGPATFGTRRTVAAHPAVSPGATSAPSPPTQDLGLARTAAAVPAVTPEAPLRRVAAAVESPTEPRLVKAPSAPALQAVQLAGGPPPQPAQGPTERSKKWLWIALAVVVLGGGAATAIILLTSGP